jgi:hypothetical protein
MPRAEGRLDTANEADASLQGRSELFSFARVPYMAGAMGTTWRISLLRIGKVSSTRKLAE